MKALLICGFLTGKLPRFSIGAYYDHLGMVLWAQEPMEDKTFGNDCAGILDPKILMEKVKLKAAGATSVSDMLSTNICNESLSK